jgi:dephospho-CoA kinase
VCSMFARKGVPVLSADDIAKQIMRDDRLLHRKLASLLGPSTYLPNGELDRKYVAGKIFSDPHLQKEVNALVHPRVEAELKKRFLTLGRSGEKIGIVEAALIYEAGYDRALDFVVVVDAPEASRIERVVRRDGSKKSDVRKRIRAQWPVRQKLKWADYVIRNTGSPSDLEASVRFLLTLLKNIVNKP